MSSAEELKKRVKERAETTAVDKPVKTLDDQIYAMIPQLQQGASSEIDSKKLARLILTEVRKTPALASCSRASFFGGMMTIAQIGLEPGPLGHVYMIPYKGHVSVQIGYRGLMELVMRSGKVDAVYAYPVYEGDLFRYKLGTNVSIEHEPCGEGDDAKITYVYAVGIVKGTDVPRVEVMSRKQIESIRKRSQAGASGPWLTDYAEMARKTVLKRLCKTLPMSTDAATGISMDETINTNHVYIDPVSMFEIGEQKAEKVETEEEAKK